MLNTAALFTWFLQKTELHNQFNDFLKLIQKEPLFSCAYFSVDALNEQGYPIVAIYRSSFNSDAFEREQDIADFLKGQECQNLGSMHRYLSSVMCLFDLVNDETQLNTFVDMTACEQKLEMFSVVESSSVSKLFQQFQRCKLKNRNLSFESSFMTLRKSSVFYRFQQIWIKSTRINFSLSANCTYTYNNNDYLMHAQDSMYEVWPQWGSSGIKVLLNRFFQFRHFSLFKMFFDYLDKLQAFQLAQNAFTAANQTNNLECSGDCYELFVTGYPIVDIYRLSSRRDVFTGISDFFEFVSENSEAEFKDSPRRLSTVMRYFDLENNKAHRDLFFDIYVVDLNLEYRQSYALKVGNSDLFQRFQTLVMQPQYAEKGIEESFLFEHNLYQRGYSSVKGFVYIHSEGPLGKLEVVAAHIQDSTQKFSLEDCSICLPYYSSILESNLTAVKLKFDHFGLFKLFLNYSLKLLGVYSLCFIVKNEFNSGNYGTWSIKPPLFYADGTFMEINLALKDFKEPLQLNLFLDLNICGSQSNEVKITAVNVLCTETWLQKNVAADQVVVCLQSFIKKQIEDSLTY